LSDPKRRREYDILYDTRADKSTDPNAANGFFSKMFGGNTSTESANGDERPDADHVFADVFDDVRYLSRLFSSRLLITLMI